MKKKSLFSCLSLFAITALCSTSIAATSENETGAYTNPEVLLCYCLDSKGKTVVCGVGSSCDDGAGDCVENPCS